MTSPTDEFFTAHELAAILKLNVMTIYRYIKAGKLRAHKIGKEFRIAKTDFDVMLRQTATDETKSQLDSTVGYYYHSPHAENWTGAVVMLL